MKKIFIIVLVGIFIISSFGTIGIANTDQTIEKIEFIQCQEPEIIDNKEYCSVGIPEATTYLKNPGQPVLPVIIKTYTFPRGTIISEVLCQPLNIQEMTISKDIAFAGKPIPKDITLVKTEQSKKDMTIYSSSAFYPNTWYTYSIGVGLDGEEHVTYLTIQIFPIRYSPLNGIIKYTGDIDIKIKYELPKGQEPAPDEYELVIIAPLKFSLQLKSLVNHKEQMGVKTNLITTQKIYRQYEGKDRQEKIKHFIKDAAEDWGVSYMLFFGGMKGQRFWSWNVPIQYSNLDDASDFENHYISDLYYADIYKYDNTTGYTFDDWDSNGNGVCGEWNSENKDVLDMYPDVYVGRIPCRYIFEIKKQVNRIITYETSTKGSEWFNKMAVIGGDSFDDISWNTSTDYLEGQEITEYALSFMDGFESTKIWAEEGDYELSTENIETVLNEGQGFVLFDGHGNPMTWSTHPHADFSTWIGFGVFDIKNLQNGDKLPVVIVGGCHNSQFDVSIFRILNARARMWGEATTKCWAWQFLSASKGGSIASIGCTGLGYGTIGDGPDPPDEIPDSAPDGIPDCIQYLGGWIEAHFYEVYNHVGRDRLGQTHGETLTDYLNQFPIDWEMNWEDHEQSATLVDCKTVQQWALFGDPSLKIGGY